MGSRKRSKKNEQFEQLSREMKQKNYRREDQIFEVKDTDLHSRLIPLPFIIFAVIGYFWRWGSEATPLWEINLLLFFFLFVVSFPIHELIHGLTWGYYAKNKLKSIRFGFNTKEFMPYCHCIEALKARAYKIGVLAPVVVLGGGYFFLSLLFPNTELILLSAFNMFMATGDLIVLWKARVIKSGLIIDHPKQPGFVVFTKKD